MITTNSTITEGQRTFINALYAGFDNFIELRLINGAGTRQLFLKQHELEYYVPPTDTNVYIGIFERKKRKGTADSCSKTNALYLDFDDMDLSEIKYRVDMAGLPQPSMVVNSGHGYHCYWLLDKPAGPEVQPIIKALQEKLHADPQAVDISRILRLPDTMNVKGAPVPCELISYSGVRNTLATFEGKLSVKPKEIAREAKTAIPELLKHKENGLHNMAGGVGQGERNFCAGRIIQTLKRLNYSKPEVVEIIFKWNTLNSPQKSTAELKREINTFWHDERYKYDGKEFSDERLQELNERFIDSTTTFFNGLEEDTHHYDNELLHPKTFQKVSGLTFAILSIIKLSENDGIRKEHIADLCKRDKADRNLKSSLKMLHDMGYITIKKKKRINFYLFSEKANYKRGYTAIGKSLHRSFIFGELKEHEYKLMILLESYAHDNKKQIFPSTATLALRSGLSDRTIRRNLQQLEHKQFIKMTEQAKKRHIRLIYR